jgi:cellulose synthase/poly-beta-1,6-N-acetylglucosamine synthase-like glycosyltransferase
VNNPEHVKRKAMLKGYQCSTGRYIVFIDSDVMWRTHTLHHLLVPFTRDHKIGGVTGSLEVVQPNNLSTLLFSYQAKRLEFQLSQYFSAMHLPLSVLSGRTSAYRREAVEDAVRALVSDSFQGKPNASGDDVFLPRFLRRNGWKTWFQSDAVFTTSPPRNLHTFIRQTIRWSRGTTRQMISTILEPKQDKVRTLNSNISSNMDILNALLLVGALLVTLWGQPLLGLCLIVLSFLGSLLPLFFYDTKLFIRNGLAIAVYEHLIGFVRLYGVFTPWNESWLTR